MATTGTRNGGAAAAARTIGSMIADASRRRRGVAFRAKIDTLCTWSPAADDVPQTAQDLPDRAVDPGNRRPRRRRLVEVLARPDNAPGCELDRGGDGAGRRRRRRHRR